MPATKLCPSNPLEPVTVTEDEVGKKLKLTASIARLTIIEKWLPTSRMKPFGQNELKNFLCEIYYFKNSSNFC